MTLLINWWLDDKPAGPCCTEIDDDAASFLDGIHRELAVPPAVQDSTGDPQPEAAEIQVLDLIQDAGIKFAAVEADIFVAGAAHPISFFLPENGDQNLSKEPVSVQNMGHVRRLQTAYGA